MHPPQIRADVARLVEEGLSDGEIARRTGVARTTVRDMRRPRGGGRPRCWRCWLPTRPVRFSAGEYAELLGLYLGDGHISAYGRTHRLRIALDARHAQVVADTRGLLQRCFPANRVGVVRADGGATAVVSVYSSHLVCLLPQHGAGQKHRRPIVLEPWQHELVRAAPWSFLRGCLHSDGCFFINRTGAYRYLSADFCNASTDLRGLFVEACELVGIQARPAGDRVRIYRREDVRRVAAFVGAKW